MKVLDSELMKRYARMAIDGFNQGWHERNGGNLSYRMKIEEIEQLRDDFKEGEWRVIGWQKGDESAFPGLAGEYFIVSGSGKYFRNIELDPEDNVCIIELNEKGNRYRIVWGLREGGMPTSELPTHLANLEVLKARDPEMRVVYHCHSYFRLTAVYSPERFLKWSQSARSYSPKESALSRGSSAADVRSAR